MKIKQIVPKPFEKAISPTLSFEVQIAYTNLEEAIVGIDGFLESDDGKILATVIEIAPEKANTSGIGARGSMQDSEFKEAVYSSTLIALLEKSALSYIEKRRMANKKGDIFLTLNLNIQNVVSAAKISHFHEIAPQETPIIPTQVNVVSSSGRRVTGKILAYGHDREYSSAYSNLWIISGDGGPTFLRINKQNLKKEGIRIPSVDWIHDYSPKLGIGEYFIVEIPKGKKVVKDAWKYIDKAEECYRQWDTKGAYAHCREVGTLLNNTLTKKFRLDPIIKKWKRANEKFVKLTSMDLHEEDIKKEEPKGEIIVGRPETEHIIIVTKALIKYAEELLQE